MRYEGDARQGCEGVSVRHEGECQGDESGVAKRDMGDDDDRHGLCTDGTDGTVG